MKKILFFLLALPVSSCITINSIGYKSLSTTQKKALTTLDSYEAIRDTPFKLVMTDGRKLRALMQPEEYTWVHYWIPYCNSPVCRPLSYYQKLANGTGTKMRMLTVSQVYDYEDIQAKFYIDGYSKPILVPNALLYERGTNRARRHFTADLTGDKALSKQKPTHMIFRHDSLIYSGGDMTASILDSVLRQ